MGYRARNRANSTVGLGAEGSRQGDVVYRRKARQEVESRRTQDGMERRRRREEGIGRQGRRSRSREPRRLVQILRSADAKGRPRTLAPASMRTPVHIGTLMPIPPLCIPIPAALPLLSATPHQHRLLLPIHPQPKRLRLMDMECRVRRIQTHPSQSQYHPAFYSHRGDVAFIPAPPPLRRRLLPVESGPKSYAAPAPAPTPARAPPPPAEVPALRRTLLHLHRNPHRGHPRSDVIR
ncbi:hypothetical protein B0H19DRAFT_541585 [Mycena capillaripes]|nr:hypothetical protein B0H19DRAFT_541585 [Mycena capillaripes]